VAQADLKTLHEAGCKRVPASGLLIERDCVAGVRLASGREIRARQVILCAGAYGPVPGSVYAGHRFIDVFIHGWDLANTTGQDTALDAHLMEACRQIIEPQLELFRGAGALAAELPVPPDAAAQTRFLAMVSRSG
jgi:uncharacterized protein (TIGR03086 family)